MAKAKSRQKTRGLQKKAALRKLMSDAEGRMWMWDLLTLCGIFHSSFSVEALRCAFNEGRRDIGLRLLADINQLSPELYIRMMGENQEKEKD
ncbi:MAG: hypothetical protein ABSG35_21335 [Syntrophobacteraceae bacterium]